MKSRLVALGACCLLLAAGCKNNPFSASVTVTYGVSGSAARADVTYATGHGGTSQRAGVSLPWTSKESIERGGFVYISAQNDTSSGCVTVSLDQPTYRSTTSCGAYVIASLSGTAE